MSAEQDVGLRIIRSARVTKSAPVVSFRGATVLPDTHMYRTHTAYAILPGGETIYQKTPAIALNRSLISFRSHQVYRRQQKRMSNSPPMPLSESKMDMEKQQVDAFLEQSEAEADHQIKFRCVAPQKVPGLCSISLLINNSILYRTLSVRLSLSWHCDRLAQNSVAVLWF